MPDTTGMYNLAELGQWVHLLAARAMTQPEGSEARTRDLRGALRYLGVMHERLSALGPVAPNASPAAPAPARPAAPPPASTPAPTQPARTAAQPSEHGDDVRCPVCSGPCWDNRLSKRNPRAPDWKCKDRSCEGCVWPAREGEGKPNGKSSAMPTAAHDDEPPEFNDEDFPF